jgi:hypothetical protein
MQGERGANPGTIGARQVALVGRDSLEGSKRVTRSDGDGWRCRRALGNGLAGGEEESENGQRSCHGESPSKDW